MQFVFIPSLSYFIRDFNNNDKSKKKIELKEVNEGIKVNYLSKNFPYLL